MTPAGAPRRAHRRQASGLGTGGVFVVVGDWFVDEHWVCGEHRSSSSSRTGREHLRVLHPVSGNVQAFCGAGRSAFYLHHVYRLITGLAATSVVGLGFWHTDDTGALGSMFNTGTEAANLYRLSPPTGTAPAGVRLVNMNDALNSDKTGKEGLAERRNREYTTRIIRIYRYLAAEGTAVYDRLDWEPKAPRTKLAAGKGWNRDKLEALSTQLARAIDGRPVRAVLIKDLNKGAITEDIVRWLTGQKSLRHARWYVSSKRWRPEWLQKLAGIRPRLLMVPQVAAQELARSKTLSGWITRAGRPTKEAIDLLDELATSTRARSIVVLPEGLSALGCECQDRKIRDCVVQPKPAPEPITVDMGGASILFPALVACLEDPRYENATLEAVLPATLRTTHEWVESEATRVTSPRAWDPNPSKWPRNVTFVAMQKFLAEPSAAPLRVDAFGVKPSIPWAEAKAEWTAALSRLGVVGRHSERGGRLELWRAMQEVDGFVCCDVIARRQLRHMLQGIQAFVKHPRHHASCMLVASPGSGKTFLAKRLARTEGLTFVPFNITQMRSKADILECLDTVVATQAETGHKRLLVFVDEINAALDGGRIYGSFLTPLEDGTYVRNGRAFSIRPCLWVFAGTEHPESIPPVDEDHQGAKEKRRVTAGEKESDFVSRLSLGTIDLTRHRVAPKSDNTVEGASDIKMTTELEALENVYLGVVMLRSEYPDVRRISERVLQAFLELPLTVTVREIKHFVRRFEDIQYGDVTSRSVPTEWPGENGAQQQARWVGVREELSDKADIEIVVSSDRSP